MDSGLDMLREIGSAASFRERVFVCERPEDVTEREGQTVLIASVMHCGTHFVMWELFRDHEDRTNKGDGKRGYISLHLHDYAMPRIRELAQRIPCIVPFRHPFASAQSWKNRRKSMTVWASMVRNAVSMRDDGVYYLPLDVRGRDDFLRRVNAGIEAEVSTDWPVVKYDREGNFYTGMSKEDSDLVREVWDENVEFFISLGYK